MIEFEDLTVKYTSDGKTYTALDDICLTVPTGTTCAIIGPSGCGKSTLLKVAAGIIHGFDGKVLMEGEPVQPAQHRIGFMPQNYGLLPWRTVDDNITLGVRIKDKGKPVDMDILNRLKAQLGIETLGGRYPGELSGGQCQRAGLARAFLLRPDVLLMDEPFSALDAITREEMQDVFLALWQKYHVTTVLVTHYVEEALYLGQKIVVMSADPGHIVREIDNPLFGGREARSSQTFFAMGLKLRNLIKAGVQDES
jgi:NitT/TauT family transport system ATP-binding protein